MSDLEDDVLMAYIKQGQELLNLQGESLYLQERNRLLESVWRDLDRLVRRLISMPELARPLDPELQKLKRSVQSVLALDAKHKDGEDASGGDASG